MKGRTTSETLRSRKGSVLLLVVMTLAAVLGIVGLAIDAGRLYITRQQAQSAADAAALAGVMDLYNNSGFATPPFAGAAISCIATSSQAPCAYARMNGFNPPDNVLIRFNNSCPRPVGVKLVATPVGVSGLICTTVTRVVNTTLMRVLGVSNSTVTASAEAAIIGGNTLTPLIVTQPTIAGALSLSAGSTLTLCSGPAISIQVNSISQTAFLNSGTVDLSKAGTPAASYTCTGNGGSLRVVGGPAASPGGLSLGIGTYSPGISTISDPLSSIAPPGVPAAAPAPSTVATAGLDGCPAAPCTLYSPGLYPTGITVSGSALFLPGIYYLASGGFQGLAGGCMAMATGAPADPATGWTQNMLVYATGGGTFSTSGTFGQGCVQNSLTGSPGNSAYQGLLFFQDRNSALATHNFAGSGSFALTGGIYFNSSNSAQYQTLNLSGGPVTVIGDIIVGQLTLNGSSLTMYLASQQSAFKQVALVQ